MTKRDDIVEKLTGITGIGTVRAQRIYDQCGKSRCIETIVNNPDYVRIHGNVPRDVVYHARETFMSNAFGLRPDTADGTWCVKDEAEIRKEFAMHWRALEAQRQYVDKIADIHRERLLSRPDVTGMHVGLWRRGGKIVCPLQYCIRVHVQRKLQVSCTDETLIATPNRYMPTPLERLIDGVRVDVLSHNYDPVSALTDKLRSKARTLRGGYAIAPDHDPDNWGTLGIRVDHLHDGMRYFLTNAHVVGSRGAQVQQPFSDARKDSLDIGSVVDAPVFDEFIDAALIADSKLRRTRGDVQSQTGKFIAKDLTQADVDRRTIVFKIGAATGRTSGRVKSINYSPKFRDVQMNRQILVEADHKIIDGGDSGAVLYVRDEEHDINIVVGLVHGKTFEKDAAGNVIRDGFGLVASPIGRVIERLKIKI